MAPRWPFTSRPEALLRPHINSPQTKKRLEKRSKGSADPLQLVFVREMWLTSFDAPCVYTLYVDKPMKGHNLMQAIPRVNRVFKDKQGGLVVDYIGNELKAAMKEYTNAAGRGRSMVDVAEAYSLLMEKVVKRILRKYKYPPDLQDSAVELVLEQAQVVGESWGDGLPRC